MKRLQLYIATSLDGYIARPDGAIDWLENLPNPHQIDHGYADFYAGIDTVVMGRHTYETILGFDLPWPYADCQTYVVTTQSTYPTPTPDTQVLGAPLGEAIQQLQQQSGKNIWVVGGGQLTTALLHLGKIDDLLWTLIPTVIGAGIPLFQTGIPQTAFNLVTTKAFETGAVLLHYQRRP